MKYITSFLILLLLSTAGWAVDTKPSGGTGGGGGVTTVNGRNGAVTLVGTDTPAFIASGASHAAGAVPDPGVTAGATKFLREDATWVTPAGAGTVTSVAATVPSIFSIAGSPITGAGTLAMTYSGTALPIANGGTGQTTAAAAFQALSPITTLGDLTIGGAAGVPARLAGNVTTARQFLAQTGNGSVSAAPLWVGPLSLSDLPATLPGSIIGSSAVGVTFGGTGLDASAAANGKLLIGTGTGLALANLTQGANATITNSSGGITISAAGLTTVADANYTALLTDKTISYTSITASRTVTLPAASTATLGQWYEVNDSSGSVTNAITISIARNGTDTIEGGTASWVIRNAGGYRRFYAASSTNWKLVAMSEDVQTFTGAGSYTWTKEPGARSGFAEGIGGGSAGGSGAVEASGTVACSGGAGSGGGYAFRRFNISDAGSTETVVVGAGGTAGAAQASASSNGNAGGAGGNSSFGSSQLVTMQAKGASTGGAGGTTSSGTAGLAGGGVVGGSTGSTASTTGAGGNNAGNLPSGNSGGGGAAGGGITSAGTPFQNGGFGGPGSVYRADWGNAGSQGNTRGAADGAAGGSPTDSTIGAVVSGPGGGGGASSILANGGAGGTGAKYGGGGGGGGAALNTHSSGAGGAGGEGIVVVRQTY